jgi:hypothetical protein
VVPSRAAPASAVLAATATPSGPGRLMPAASTAAGLGFALS